MNNQKVKEIVKFSLQKNIQNKWFVLLNVIVLITTIAMTNVENIKSFMKNNNINVFDKETTIEIIDDGNIAKDKLIKKFEGSENIKFVEKTGTEYNKDNILDDYIVIEINKSDDYIITAKVISKEGIDSSLYDGLINVLKEARSEEFANELNIEKTKLDILNEEPNIERIMLSVDTENSETKEIIKTVSTFIIYFISIFIFSKIANEIAQEKVSKSIEYVLTSVSAEEYLLAKIISVIGFIIIQRNIFLSLLYDRKCNKYINKYEWFSSRWFSICNEFI